ncbi:hypothetical protein [Fuchsiella alkaliacetigena]|uniref:hypothetical protein n=1 Tax=Fuchsiella alkaliacetigena TaxID=957042 RepID=UPI00200AE138|nr:hypothetical protein [Fuchsiella alkaliacetigena]MCK8826049.1 hypothetical protein [Fuchsiella alkaliacetigena]
MLHSITHQEIEKAIDYLANNMPKDTLLQIQEQLKNNDPSGLFRLGLGIKVRNLLKEEFNWNDYVLNELWGRLIIRAAKKVQD